MSARRRGGSLLLLLATGVLAALVVAITATVMAILGSSIACMGGGSIAVANPPTKAAVKGIPPKRLRIYQQAGKRFDVDWAFLDDPKPLQQGEHDAAADDQHAQDAEATGQSDHLAARRRPIIHHDNILPHDVASPKIDASPLWLGQTGWGHLLERRRRADL